MKRLFSVDHVSKNIDVALLISRLGIAGLMLTHGIPKLQRLNESPVKFMDFLGMGETVSLGLVIVAEVVCSIFILLGLGTRLAVIPIMITMLVAVFHVHGADPFAKQEMGLHFLLVYVFLLIMGSGKYSMDNLLLAKATPDYPLQKQV
ncbi:MAG TPA: DoxX family protein [Chitinophagaceae bacterium]